MLTNHYQKNGFVTSNFSFREGYSANVIAEIVGTKHPDEIIVMGAHYDCIPTRARGPGADDNGSGTMNLMEFAALVNLTGVKFERTLRIVSFSGEEQGLVGSRAYARNLAENNVNVVAMFNSDMLGWVLPGKPMTLGMKDRFIDKELLKSANVITALYVPNLPIGLSNSCCSDHQSFTEAGFSAIGYFENTAGASNYPFYHTSQDLPEHVNITQVLLESKAMMAAVLTYAGAHA